MTRWPWRRLPKITENDIAPSDKDDLVEKVKEAADKLQATEREAREYAKALAAARRVRYKTDRFTSEMYDSARAPKHG